MIVTSEVSSNTGQSFSTYRPILCLTNRFDWDLFTIYLSWINTVIIVSSILIR